MSISDNTKASSPRQQRTRLKGEATQDSVENNQGQSENTVNEEQVTNMSANESSSNPAPLAPLPGNRPIASSTLAVRETMSMAGVRPIAPSDLQVVETMNIMGVRPIGANTIHIVDTINLSGVRPIASSALVVSQTYSSMGNRPIASNEIDDSYGLMGFLD